MTTVQINENTKIGKNIIEMLKFIAKSENERAVKFLDETDYLFASPKNKEVLLDGVEKIKNGDTGVHLNIAELWK
jgi:hypothetical protein